MYKYICLIFLTITIASTGAEADFIETFDSRSGSPTRPSRAIANGYLDGLRKRMHSHYAVAGLSQIR
jgi:hypothetical protein